VISVVFLAGQWPSLTAYFGDNEDFVSVAVALRRGTTGEIAPTAFWGLSYIIAAISAISPLTGTQALWSCSWAASIGTVWVAFDLWGATVATWLGIASYAWLQRAALGG